ncbi:MAG: hypothetical protein OEY01_10860 [Desulfobulbaceae bacterium]|nr:hypothetical protein [Desulfobulbaceae bacterium]
MKMTNGVRYQKVLLTTLYPLAEAMTDLLLTGGMLRIKKANLHRVRAAAMDTVREIDKLPATQGGKR